MCMGNLVFSLAAGFLTLGLLPTQSLAATMDWQGATWYSSDTILQAKSGEPVRGNYYFEPCASHADWADVCVAQSMWYIETFPVFGQYSLVSNYWSGQYIFVAFEYILNANAPNHDLHFLGEVLAGNWVDDGSGGQYLDMNNWDSSGSIAVVVTTTTPIPLPATGVLAAAGLGFLTLLRRRKSGAV